MSGQMRQTPKLKDPEGTSDGVGSSKDSCCRSRRRFAGAQNQRKGGTRLTIGWRLMTDERSLQRELEGVIPSDSLSTRLLSCSWTSHELGALTRIEEAESDP